MEEPRQAGVDEAPAIGSDPARRDPGAARPRAFGWRWALLAVLTAGIVVLLVRNFGGAGELLRALRGASVPWVLASFALSWVCVLVGVTRWRIVLHAMGYRVSFRRAYEVVLATWPLTVVAPSRANELLRAFAIRDVVPVYAATGSVLAEKAVDFTMLLVLTTFGAAASGLLGAFAALLLATLGFVGGVLLLLRQRERVTALPLLRARATQLQQLFGAFDALRRDPARFGQLAALSLTVRLITVAILHTLLVAVGAGVGLWDTLTRWPLAVLVGLAPVTIAGMGTRDAAFIWLVGQGGARLSEAQLLAATMGYSALSIWAFAAIGLPYMLRETLRHGARR